MIDRRRFIESGVAGSLAGAFAAWGWPRQATASSALRSREVPAGSALQSPGSPRETDSVRRVPLHAAIFDERFAEAARFGRAAERLGLPVRGLRGDVTDLWYSQLHPLWKQRAQPIAGLTAYAALFCLERLGRDHGMRVVYHGKHTRLGGGQVEHILEGPHDEGPIDEDPIEQTEPGRSWAPHGAGADRSDWPTAIASLIARAESRAGWSGLPPARHAAGARFITPRSPPEQGAGQPLHSWVIAPPARA